MAAKPLRRVNSKSSVIGANEESADFVVENAELQGEMKILASNALESISNRDLERWARRHGQITIISLAYYAMNIVEEIGKDVEISSENKSAMGLHILLELRLRMEASQIIGNDESKKILSLITRHRELINDFFAVAIEIAKHPETLDPVDIVTKGCFSRLFSCFCWPCHSCNRKCRKGVNALEEGVEEFVDTTSAAVAELASDVEQGRQDIVEGIEEAEREAAENSGSVNLNVNVNID